MADDFGSTSGTSKIISLPYSNRENVFIARHCARFSKTGNS
jgi:hypothetical protein